MRYGALPVVRRTGGLADTVRDLDSDRAGGNGFVFEGMDHHDMKAALERAVRFYRDSKDQWDAVRKRVMMEDNSWGSSIGQYLNLY